MLKQEIPSYVHAKLYADNLNKDRVAKGLKPLSNSAYFSCVNDYQSGYTDALRHLAEALAHEVTQIAFTKDELMRYITNR